MLPLGCPKPVPLPASCLSGFLGAPASLLKASPLVAIPEPLTA